MDREPRVGHLTQKDTTGESVRGAVCGWIESHVWATYTQKDSRGESGLGLWKGYVADVLGTYRVKEDSWGESGNGAVEWIEKHVWATLPRRTVQQG